MMAAQRGWTELHIPKPHLRGLPRPNSEFNTIVAADVYSPSRTRTTSLDSSSANAPNAAIPMSASLERGSDPRDRSYPLRIDIVDQDQADGF